MSELNYSIIIPTRNRHELLQNLIQSINLLDENLIKIIIVDSSDDENKSLFLKNSKISYIYTNIRSASIQRNIGIKSLPLESKLTFFLDDDVKIEKNYFDELIKTLLGKNAIGVSGLAINTKNEFTREIPHGVIGNIKKIFLLDSVHDGKLLKSAINIPCRQNSKGKTNVVEVEWLIGCALWKNEIFKYLNFENSFIGQSLGEDLLFSNLATRYGKIAVNKAIKMDHHESMIGRPDEYEFYKMWVRNRYLISKKLKLSPLNIAFHWSNIGKILALVFYEKNNNQKAIFGLCAGYWCILRDKTK
jgi:GT2 family glycosyltransferase